jgi:hypothetical protein
MVIDWIKVAVWIATFVISCVVWAAVAAAVIA